jgi:DMSO/TMAO reductase YedYZ molybdopterin-dependent catalytic subunit
MLAWEMNGLPLPYEHGFPVRMVTPGCIAVRSPKWIKKLIISDEEADLYVPLIIYLLFC